MKTRISIFALLLVSQIALADVALTDRAAIARVVAGNNAAKTHATTKQKLQLPTPENLAKRATKAAKHKGHAATTARLRTSGHTLRTATNATGSIQLTDASGLQYFINDNITFSTTSSASGAASEASFTGPVIASTSAGGTTTSTLNDAFDGYETTCLSFTNQLGPCRTGDADYQFYNQTGADAVADPGVPATPECTNRQYLFPVKTLTGVDVQRRVFVPTNDNFIRWYDTYTNTTGAPVTFTVSEAHNLGSDSNTRVTATSSGDNLVTVADNWAASFQNFSGNTSSDPRLGHVFQGPGAATPLAAINFVDGDDNPYWTYSLTLAAGQTKSLLNFATGVGTQAAAAAKAAQLDALPANATQCLTNTQLGQIVNFAVSADLSITKTGPATGFSTQNVSYTITVANAGPSPANAVTVTDVLPTGSTFVSATGSGWTCSQAAGTVTCTMASLAVGPASPITLTIMPPVVATTTNVSNTATVTSSSNDPNPANNSSTATVAIHPANQIPTMSQFALMALGMLLVGVALIRIVR